jgi:hypothetical protein
MARQQLLAGERGGDLAGMVTGTHSGIRGCLQAHLTLVVSCKQQFVGELVAGQQGILLA